jgi:flagellar motor switch protein FliN
MLAATVKKIVAWADVCVINGVRIRAGDSWPMADDENQTTEAVLENAEAPAGTVPAEDSAAAMDESAVADGAMDQASSAAGDMSADTQEGVLLEDGVDGLPWYEGANNLVGMGDVQLNFTVVLGTVDMQLDQFLKLGRGAIVELRQNKNDLVALEVNGHHIGRGDITVVDEFVGVIVEEIGMVAAKAAQDDMSAAMDDDPMAAAMGDDPMAAAMDGGEDDMAAMMAAMDNGE